MPEETNEPSVRPKHPASPRLGLWSRIGATTIGLAGLGSGAVAVFVTNLEAGPVGLLAVGFLLLLIGMSGRLPSRLKLGDNEAEWQEEREAVQEFVERVAADSPESKNTDLISALDKLAQAAPEVANPALSALAYEALVMETIAELARSPAGEAGSLGFNFTTSPPGGRNNSIDAILEATDGTKIALEIKSYKSGLPWDVVRRAYGNFLRLRESQSDIGTLLLISRNEPSRAALNILSEPGEEIRLAVIKDAKDAKALKAAIRAAFDAARIIAREGPLNH